MKTTLQFIVLCIVSVLAIAQTPMKAAPSEDVGRIPVVFATDIAGDIDDTWALAQILRSPRLDLKLVLTETGEARYRAAVAAKLLEVAGRTDVDVGLGRDFGAMPDKDRLQSSWLLDYDLAKYPGKVHEDGIAAFITLVQESTQPITVISVGPAPTLAEALTRAPDLAKKCRLVGMFGSFDVGYGGSATPEAEYNVKAYPAELRTVLGAAWMDVLLTPLDTCGTVNLSAENYHAVWSATDDALIRAVIENYCLWAPRVPWMRCDFFAVRSTTLFDCVAVYLAYAEDLVEIETLTYRITDEGFTVRDPAGPLKARVALRWKDLAAFETHLSQELTRR